MQRECFGSGMHCQQRTIRIGKQKPTGICPWCGKRVGLFVDLRLKEHEKKQPRKASLTRA